jgi:signal transduction histidine kinase
MSRSALLAAIFGVTVGSGILVVALAMEILLRGLPPIAGLVELHRQSPAIWVLDSMPFLLGLAASSIATRPAAVGSVPWARAAPPVPVESLTRPPAGPGSTGPPPVPNTLRQATISDGSARSDAAARLDGALAALPGPTASHGVVRTPTIQGPPGGVPVVPPGLASVVPGQSGGLITPSDARVKALQELVKVLKEQTERMASESRAKSAYLANMSHELRTPLSAIVGYAELLQEEAEERRLDLAEDLRKVAESGRALVEQINNILDLSKIEVGQLAVVLEDVDMAQIVAEVRVAVAPVTVGNPVTFSTRVAPGARLVRGDHMRLRQVILHLLSNAFKFTRQGQVQLLVDKATPKRDAWIAIRVRDTGTGMDEAKTKRVFDEYAQAMSRVEAGSTGGLGLAIARKLAELMGGRVEVSSEKGVGSTFSVILPPAKISEDTIAPRSSIALNERLHGTRLMIVDADPFGISLHRYLERAGLAVKLVPDAASGRVMHDREQQQMAVVDVGLHDVWPLVEDLVVDGVKVVVSSLRDEDVERALQLGVTSFMLRPLDRKLVLATLERCLDGRPADQTMQ